MDLQSIRKIVTMMRRGGNMIDGGRSYIRSSGCPVYSYVVRDGEMVRGL